MNMYNLGAKIKQFWLSRQYTQQTLADYLEVTKSMVSAYENGTRYPSYPVLVKKMCIRDRLQPAPAVGPGRRLLLYLHPGRQLLCDARLPGGRRTPAPAYRPRRSAGGLSLA